MSNMLITGSMALAINGDKLRVPRDIDVIARWDDYEEFVKTHKKMGSCKKTEQLGPNKYVLFTYDKKIYEFDIAHEGDTNWELLEKYKDVHCVPSSVVLTMKESHKYLKNSPHFWKTRRDILWLRQKYSIPEEFKEWFKRREKETYDYSHPKLNQRKKDFFSDDGIKYIYDHDAIHRVVATKQRPAYEYYKIPKEDVKCSKELFLGCSKIVRLLGVYEEACVLALERSLIPHQNWEKEPEIFKHALMKVCTSITSGWFREFAWENADTVLEMYEPGFLKNRYEAHLSYLEDNRV